MENKKSGNGMQYLGDYVFGINIVSENFYCFVSFTFHVMNAVGLSVNVKYATCYLHHFRRKSEEIGVQNVASSARMRCRIHLKCFLETRVKFGSKRETVVAENIPL